MKIITFQGGLGNQMFQYQFYRWLQIQIDDKIYGYYPSKALQSHNGLELENCFFNVELPKSNIIIDFYAKFLKLLRKIKIANKISKNDNFDIKKIIFEDYWLDLKYISTFRFEIKEELLKKNQKNIHTLENIEKTNSISIHVRRSDYLSEKLSKIYAGICSEEYYQRAVDFMIGKNKNTVFYVFSDEIKWCENTLNIPNAVFINWNKNTNNVADLYLMSRCKHNIIANSTFSWWAAFLNENAEQMVIAPKRWFNEGSFEEPNIFPENWIRL
ncbi:alpha-1,2-fucosyltransferase [Bacteroidia bacterium]|nr:alpha-1,2-fucosyltransferase [Bacteroidia bacterium]